MTLRELRHCVVEDKEVADELARKTGEKCKKIDDIGYKIIDRKEYEQDLEKWKRHQTG